MGWYWILGVITCLSLMVGSGFMVVKIWEEDLDKEDTAFVVGMYVVISLTLAVLAVLIWPIVWTWGVGVAIGKFMLKRHPEEVNK